MSDTLAEIIRSGIKTAAPYGFERIGAGRIPRDVKKRIFLRRCDIRIHIPQNAEKRSLRTPEGLIDVVQFSWKMGNRNSLNIFVRHTSPEQFIGTTIDAEAEVWLKVIDDEDESTYLYIDLYPSRSKGGLPHTVKIVHREHGKNFGGTFNVPAPPPLEGYALVFDEQYERPVQQIRALESRVAELAKKGWTVRPYKIDKNK